MEGGKGKWLNWGGSGMFCSSYGWLYVWVDS